MINLSDCIPDARPMTKQFKFINMNDDKLTNSELIQIVTSQMGIFSNELDQAASKELLRRIVHYAPKKPTTKKTRKK